MSMVKNDLKKKKLSNGFRENYSALCLQHSIKKEKRKKNTSFINNSNNTMHLLNNYWTCSELIRLCLL